MPPGAPVRECQICERVQICKQYPSGFLCRECAIETFVDSRSPIATDGGTNQ